MSGDPSNEHSQAGSFSVTSSTKPICTVALGSFCEVHGPTVMLATQVFPLVSLKLTQLPPPPPPSLQSTEARRKEVCPMCESLPESAGYITTDVKTGVAFVSKRTPSALLDEVRQACVRSLSCEWTPQEVVVPVVATRARSSSGSGGEPAKQRHEPLSPEFSRRVYPFVPTMHGNRQNGYTLSLAFKVADERARGSTRWYAVAITWMGSPGYLAAAACSRMAGRVIEPFLHEIQRRAVSFEAREMEYARRKDASGECGNHSDLGTSRTLAKIVGMTAHQLYMRFHKTFCSALISLDRCMMLPGMARSPQFVLAPPPNASTLFTASSCGDTGEDEGSDNFDLLELFAKLRSADAKALLYNCMSGSQIIVRGPCEADVRSAVHSIALKLLPKELRGDVCEYSSDYLSPYEARFLGLPLSAAISRFEEVDRSFGVYEEELFGFSLTQDTGNDTDDPYGECAVLTLAPDLSRCTVRGLHFQSPMVDEMLSSLQSSVPWPRVALVQDRWMTAAKAACALQHQGLFESNDSISAALTMLGVKESDFKVFMFWMSCVKKELLRSQSNVIK